MTQRLDPRVSNSESCVTRSRQTTPFEQARERSRDLLEQGPDKANEFARERDVDLRFLHPALRSEE